MRRKSGASSAGGLNCEIGVDSANRAENFAKRLRQSMALLAIGVIATACSWSENHGYSYKSIDKDAFVKDLQAGKSTAADVAAAFGTPSVAEVNWGRKKFYYISERSQRAPAKKSVIDEQFVTEIAFDNRDLVSSVTQYTNRDLCAPYDDRTTEVGHIQYSIVQQMINNVGRFGN